jgi:3-hydroxyisobutyrate dehydrogenase-like beta-hydroxyacid dehydrogenase
MSSTQQPDSGHTMPVVGFLGPGAMGAGMVSRLLDAGYEVILWARNPAKLGALTGRGARTAADPGELVRRSDVVLGCLLDTAVIREVYLGSGGAAAAARPGQLFVEHATFDPALAVELAGALAEQGAGFLDAPVSGGPGGAANGTLVSMVGGDAAVLAQLNDVLGTYCARIRHAGATGSGLRLKLVNQLLVCTHAVAAAEASALVLRSGIDPTVAHEALMGGWAASTMLDEQLPKACAGDFDGHGAFIGGLIEVQRLVAGFVADAGVDSALLGPVREVFEASVDDGRGGQALAAMVTHYLKEQA